MVVDISSYEKDDKKGAADACRLNIDLGDRVIKLKAATIIEAEKWINVINAWREYLLLN